MDYVQAKKIARQARDKALDLGGETFGITFLQENNRVQELFDLAINHYESFVHSTVMSDFSSSESCHQKYIKAAAKLSLVAKKDWLTSFKRRKQLIVKHFTDEENSVDKIQSFRVDYNMIRTLYYENKKRSVLF